jgi:hypothetical protein
MSSVGLPLVHEEDADGVVASVFVDIRSRMPLVPALFKALAADPESLRAAWLQARAVYDHAGATEAAMAIRRSARVEVGYQPSNKVREAVAPFVAELPFMLLIVSSLRLSLDRELPRRPAPEPSLPAAAAVPEPDFSDRGDHPLFDQIYAVYGTQHLPSIFRTLAANGVLEPTWEAIGPFLAAPAGAKAISRISAEAERQARALPEVASFGVERSRPILDQFGRALPRNLIIAVTASGGNRTMSSHGYRVGDAGASKSAANTTVR